MARIDALHLSPLAILQQLKAENLNVPAGHFDEGTKENGTPCCLLILDKELVPVRPTPRRAFQGWRYLTAEDAPADMKTGKGADDVAAMPPAMRKELASLGLL